MKPKMKLPVFAFVAALTVALSLVMPSASAQEYGVQWTRGASHITTKTTTTIVSQTVTLHTLVINCSSAGTAWTISVQNKEGTAKILYAGTLATGTTVIALPVGIKMTSGIDIVTGGTTAGTADVFYTYR